MFKRKVKLDNYRKFNNEEEVREFIENFYEEYLNTLDDKKTSCLIRTHNFGVTTQNINDRKIIKAIDVSIADVPKTPYGIVVFRGDDNNCYKNENRPYLAHTFLSETADNYTKKGKKYEVYIPAGAKILTTCGLNIPGAFTEEEVLLDRNKLKKIAKFKYIYKD